MAAALSTIKFLPLVIPFFIFKETRMKDEAPMDRISRFVIWICKKFDREQISRIVQELQDILDNRNPEVKPKDDFKKNIPTTENSM
jgi:hypothetical protein